MQCKEELLTRSKSCDVQIVPSIIQARVLVLAASNTEAYQEDCTNARGDRAVHEDRHDHIDCPERLS